jgi:hypothetical protein
VKDNLAYIFNGIKFISITKIDAIDRLIDTHTIKIELALEEYKKK